MACGALAAVALVIITLVEQRAFREVGQGPTAAAGLALALITLGLCIATASRAEGRRGALAFASILGVAVVSFLYAILWRSLDGELNAREGWLLLVGAPGLVGVGVADLLLGRLAGLSAAPWLVLSAGLGLGAWTAPLVAARWPATRRRGTPAGAFFGVIAVAAGLGVVRLLILFVRLMPSLGARDLGSMVPPVLLSGALILLILALGAAVLWRALAANRPVMRAAGVAVASAAGLVAGLWLSRIARDAEARSLWGTALGLAAVGAARDVTALLVGLLAAAAMGALAWVLLRPEPSAPTEAEAW